MLGVATRGIGRRPSAATTTTAARSLSVGCCQTVAATATATAGAPRHFSGVKFLDQRRTGEETVYFKKEGAAV